MDDLTMVLSLSVIAASPCFIFCLFSADLDLRSSVVGMGVRNCTMYMCTLCFADHATGAASLVTNLTFLSLCIHRITPRQIIPLGLRPRGV